MLPNEFLGVGLLAGCTDAFPEKEGGIHLAGLAVAQSSQTVGSLLRPP